MCVVCVQAVDFSLCELRTYVTVKLRYPAHVPLGIPCWLLTGIREWRSRFASEVHRAAGEGCEAANIEERKRVWSL